MSFVRTLATLAAGYAAAKGMEKYKSMGGMAGIQQAMQGQGGGANPMAGMTDQIGSMMEQMGVPGGANGLKSMMDQFGGMGGQGGEAAMAGLGGMMAAFGGAAATGAENAGEMFEAMTGSKAATTAMEENAKLMIRAMIQAAKADGEIDADEREKILGHLGDVSPEERAFVEAEIDRPVDVAGLVAETGEGMKAQVYALSSSAIRVDNAAEAQYLDALAAGLGLSPDTRARIDAAMGRGA